MSDPLFLDRWNDSQDRGFRAFAAATFALSNIRDLPDEQRRALYRATYTINRRCLLSQVTQRFVTTATLNLITKSVWVRFTRSDWEAVLASTQNPRIGRALAALERIGVKLVRQLPYIPSEFHLPPVFAILNRLSVPIDRWQRLACELERSDAERRRAVIASARRIQSIGDFWDTYVGATTDINLSFPLAELLRPHTEVLEPLTTLKTLESEGIKMQNCLARIAWSAYSGERIFFRLRAGTPTTAELVRTRAGWKAGRVLGRHNHPIKPSESQKISSELNRLINYLPTEAIAPRPYPGGAAVAALASWARILFKGAEIARVEKELLKIRGRSRSWTDGAYMIAECTSGAFIQFMSSADGSEYICELVSHKYRPKSDWLLNAEAVDVIESTGFRWPRGVNNFRRMFRVNGPSDCRMLAEFALALLAKVYRHRSGQEINLKVHFAIEVVDDLGAFVPETEIMSVIAEECAGADIPQIQRRRTSNGECHDTNGPL